MSTLPTALQPLAWTADQRTWKLAYSCPCSSSAAPHGLWTQHSCPVWSWSYFQI